MASRWTPMLRAFGLLLALSGNVSASEPLPSVGSGRIEALDGLDFAPLPVRPVWVWLPDSYDGERPHAVLYLHDGQMLFDASRTWNGQEWRADEVAGALIAGGETRPFLIVGIGNGGERRHVEYFPQKAFEALPAPSQAKQREQQRAPGQPLFRGELAADAYLRFLVERVKPAVDARYATRRDPANTVVLGSSMGGLISLYALSEYPQVFGAAGALSTHWPGGFDPNDPTLANTLIDWFAAHLPPAGRHRLYLDYGTATLDALYPPLQARVDRVLESKGYGPSDWTTRRFEGAEHSETAWAARLAIPLRFLLPPDGPAADTDPGTDSRQ